MKRADHEFVPALGWSGLTPFYDGVIRLLTRERVWWSANMRPKSRRRAREDHRPDRSRRGPAEADRPNPDRGDQPVHVADA